MKPLFSSASACSAERLSLRLSHADRRIGAIQRRHPRLCLRADDKPVNRTPPRLRVLRIGEIVFVVRRMLRVFDDEVLPARSAHREIEFSADGQDRVTHGFGFKFAAILPPQEGVVLRRIFSAFRIAGGRLLIGGARHDQPVQACLSEPPLSRNSVASQSSNSG